MNTLGASILGVLSTLVLFSGRRWAPVWMVGGVLFLTQEQALMVSGVSLTAMRVLEMVGFVRVMLRGERFTWSRLDTSLIALYGYAALVFVLRSDTGQAYAVGTFIDALLCYVVFRALLRDTDDIAGFLQRFLILLVPYVGLLVIEAVTMRNPFGALGAATWGTLRDDRLRTMGSFRNPSLLGILAATLIPLYVGLFLARLGRVAAVFGATLCLVILVLANSGGPFAATGVGLLGWCCWSIRHRMSAIRRLATGSLVVIALAMNAPVWFLLERISGLTGGGGWHRAHLLSAAWQDLDRWWLAGMDIRETADWFPYTMEANNGGADITNAFVDFGLRAGILATILLIVLLVRAYRMIGIALAATSADAGERTRALMLWGLGCMLAAHISTFMGITYFDQFYVVWFMELAAIASATGVAAATATPRASHERATNAPPLAPLMRVRRSYTQDHT